MSDFEKIDRIQEGTFGDDGERVTRRVKITFQDGTQLRLIAIAPDMPNEDMTPREKIINGEAWSDMGDGERWELVERSSAFSTLREIVTMLQARQDTSHSEGSDT